MIELSDNIMNSIGGIWPWMLSGAVLALAAALASTWSRASSRERRREARRREEDDARSRDA